MPIPSAHLGSGALEPLLAGGPLLVLAIGYWVRSRTLARRGSPVPGLRVLSFVAGIVVAAVAVASPLEHLADELVLAHMAQHLLLGDIAALLVVLGLTGPLLQPLLAIPWLAWIRRLAHPLVAFPLWVVVLYLWHLPVLYQAAVASPALHALQHATFFGAGILMWMAMLGPLPKPAWFGFGAKVLYVGGVRLAGAALANVFMWSGTVLYPDYAGGEAQWGISPLGDQGTAGVMMMAESTILVFATLVWLFLRWAADETERQRLLDLALARGVPLDEARAARAVAAGEGSRLEERLLAGGGEPRRGGAATTGGGG
jgi:cytochrome c oxidase assembly factor CtaG